MLDGTLQNPDSEGAGARRSRFLPLAFLLVFFLLQMLSSITMALPVDPLAYSTRWNVEHLLDLGSMMALALCCVHDARARRHALPLTTHWYFLFLPQIAVPAYAIGSRGLRGVALLGAYLVTWILIGGICSAITMALWY